MPIDYSIAAIPTVYNGIRYRSRLEAKWAAFFENVRGLWAAAVNTVQYLPK